MEVVKVIFFYSYMPKKLFHTQQQQKEGGQVASYIFIHRIITFNSGYI